MFEKFTEKAINVVTEAQNIASLNGSEEVTSEHLLLALAKEAKGISLKIFRSYDIDYEKLSKETVKKSSSQTNNKPIFSKELKNLLK